MFFLFCFTTSKTTMKRIYFFTLTLLLYLHSQAQQSLQKNYEPLSSTGIIPQEFINSVNAKWQQYQKDHIDKSEKRKVRKDKKDFLLNSSQQLDAVLKSGKVTFSNDIYAYLNKLTDKILSGNTKLRNEVRIYPIGFETSNAFAFNEGALFVHVGLIARSNNEAELAFILGHEIGHYQKKHSIQQHIETKKAERQEGEYKRTDENEQLKAVRKYSREHESEADAYGYRLLSDAGYNPFAAISSLATLRRTLSPPIAADYDISLIEKGMVVIPGYYYTNALQASASSDKKEEEDAAESEEDDLSTHPSIDARIDVFLSELKVNDTINKPYYLVSKSEFEYVRELCRMEMCRIYLLENKIDLAFYHINTMLQLYPENEYLKRMMAIALARVAESASNSTLLKRIRKENACPEELIVSNYMLRKMNKEEISLLAIRYAWWVKETSSPSADIDRILKYTITNYTTKYARELSDFANKDSFSRSAVESYYFIDTTVKETASATTKKSKITKGKSTVYRYWFDRSLARFALSDVKDNSQFSALFNKVAEENPDRKTKLGRDEEDKDDKPVKDNSIVITKSKKKVESLNIHSMILIEPEYYKVDKRKKKEVDAIVNENTELRMRDLIKQSAESAGFKLTLLAGNNFETGDVQKFTDYGLLKDWMNEFFIDKKRTAIPVDYSRIKEIINRYDSRYAAFMVNVTTISNDDFGTKMLYLLVGIIYFPLLPVAILNMFPENSYSMVLAVVDLEQSKIVYGNIITFDATDSNDLFKSQMYGIFATLKGKKKTKKGEAA
jgi:Zn-dependent protease with chaperone function